MKTPKLLTAVFEHAIDGIVVTNQQGTIELVNPAVCELFGYREEEMIGKSVNMLMGPADAALHDDHLQQYQETRRQAIIGKGRELTGRKKDGTYFPFRLALSEFIDRDSTFYTGILHDLSRERQAEVSLLREKKLNELKTRLVSMASHEFRSPLSRIQLSASLIERYYQRLDQDKIMDHLRKIKTAVEDMTDTLNDFLSVERIESGTMQPDFSPFDLVKLSEELSEQARSQASVGLQLVYRHEGKEAMVPLNRALLRHCLVNLLSNAVKYSKREGLIRFTTSISRGKCTLSITDQGIGIPAEDRAKLFGAFFRASNVKDIQGTGLGLNIVKNYVGLMGGKIALKSKEGKGTSFTMTFDLLKSR